MTAHGTLIPDSHQRPCTFSMSTLDDVTTTGPPDDRVRVLDDDGSLLPGATVPDLSDEDLRAIYDDLVLARHFDERAVSFQRQGRIATYAPMAGQEGAQVASAHALGRDDWVFP